MKRTIAMLVACTIMISALAGCSPPKPQEDTPTTPPANSKTADEKSAELTTGKGKMLNVAVMTEPINFDPHVGNDANTSMVLNMVFEGLLNNVNGEFVPGMAETYEVSDDGMTYTFHLRDAKWSDGKAVTAGDFVDTYQRMLTRKESMDLAYNIFFMKNALPISEGKMAKEELGVKAPDDKTLIVELEKPFPYVKSLFAFCSLLPLRGDLLDKYGAEYASSPETISQNGPYLLKEWKHQDRMTFEPNPDYWNRDSVKLEKVVINLVPDANTTKNMYDTGEIDFMGVGSDLVSSYASDPNFTYFPTGGVQFLALSHKGTNETAAKLLSNVNFRNALSSAINREELVTAMFSMHTPSTTVVNPGISEPSGKKWGDVSKVGEKYFSLKSDPEKAKEYFDAALKETGIAASDIPTFDYLTTDNELDRTLGEYYQDVWSNVLGIKIEIRQVQFKQYYENLYTQPYDIAMTGWGPDYDDPFTYLDMWDYRGGWNKTGWNSDAFNALTEEANAQTDMNKRNELFMQAEDLLMAEGPIIPIYRKRGAYVCNPKIQGMHINGFGTTFDFRYADIVA